MCSCASHSNPKLSVVFQARRRTGDRLATLKPLLPVLLVATVGVATAFSQPIPLKSVRVNGVELHYLDQGRGPAVVLVHGGMEDYRAWAEQMEPLAKHFRVIAYSRRYNFPNDNPLTSEDHSALVDADDLAALIKALHLGRVRLVGHSYGAYIALFLTLKHPEMVQSLVLSEPPIMKWLNDLPRGKPLLDDFMNNLWRPNADAFRRHDPDAALRITVDWFGSHEQPPGGQSFSYATLSEEDRKPQMQDIREWEAITTSTDAFPALTHEQARHLRKPILLLSGSQSVPALKVIAEELARTLPSVTFVVLPKLTHEMWSEAPHDLTEKMVPFLLRH